MSRTSCSRNVYTGHPRTHPPQICPLPSTPAGKFPEENLRGEALPRMSTRGEGCPAKPSKGRGGRENKATPECTLHVQLLQKPVPCRRSPTPSSSAGSLHTWPGVRVDLQGHLNSRFIEMQMVDSWGGGVWAGGGLPPATAPTAHLLLPFQIRTRCSLSIICHFSSSPFSPVQ